MFNIQLFILVCLPATLYITLKQFHALYLAVNTTSMGVDTLRFFFETAKPVYSGTLICRKSYPLPEPSQIIVAVAATAVSHLQVSCWNESTWKHDTQSTSTPSATVTPAATAIATISHTRTHFYTHTHFYSHTHVYTHILFTRTPTSTPSAS